MSRAPHALLHAAAQFVRVAQVGLHVGRCTSRSARSHAHGAPCGSERPVVAHDLRDLSEHRRHGFIVAGTCTMSAIRSRESRICDSLSASRRDRQLGRSARTPETAPCARARPSVLLPDADSPTSPTSHRAPRRTTRRRGAHNAAANRASTVSLNPDERRQASGRLRAGLRRGSTCHEVHRRAG
jgi:hypothetical protein